MPYVHRSANNVIDAVFANLQPGVAEEFLADNNAEIIAFLNPPPNPEQVRVADIRANARRQALINALTTVDAAGLISAISNRYPALSGDAIKAVTDIYLVLIAALRS